MLIRTVVSFALLPLLLAVIYIMPGWALAGVYALICALAQYELLYVTGLIKSKPLIILSAIIAAAVPFGFYFGIGTLAALCVLTGFILIMFFIAILKNGKGTLSFEKISCAVFSIFIVPLFFSLIIPISNGENGKYVVLLPYIVAWISDTGAYFTGTFFGRHKLCPDVSPKKSVEGAIGGILMTIIFGFIYALIITGVFDKNISWLSVFFLAAVGSVLGQIGDLIFSYIKREYNIKDFGKIFPGHGGILDRFDSVVLTTPLVYIILKLFPVIL